MLQKQGGLRMRTMGKLPKVLCGWQHFARGEGGVHLCVQFTVLLFFYVFKSFGVSLSTAAPDEMVK